MPQIFGNHYQDFRQWLANQQITCFEKEITPSQYLATQCEFNIPKIQKMFNRDYVSEHSKNPIFISNDNYILDGHHRWICHWINDDMPLKALEIPLNVEDCLKLMHSYDNTNYKKVVENAKQNSSNLSR